MLFRSALAPPAPGIVITESQGDLERRPGARGRGPWCDSCGRARIFSLNPTVPRRLRNPRMFSLPDSGGSVPKKQPESPGQRVPRRVGRRLQSSFCLRLGPADPSLRRVSSTRAVNAGRNTGSRPPRARSVESAGEILEPAVGRGSRTRRQDGFHSESPGLCSLGQASQPL